MTDRFAHTTAADIAQVRFEAMGQLDAEQVASWSYPGEYAFYNSASDPEDLVELLDPAQRADRYFSVTLENNELVGFVELKDVVAGKLEIGLGLRPECVGRGFGLVFVQTLCRWAGARSSATTAILKVADFNRRAVIVYERAGFSRVGTEQWTSGGELTTFIVLERSLSPALA